MQTWSTPAEGLRRHPVSAAFWDSGALSGQATPCRAGVFSAAEKHAGLQCVRGGSFGQEA